MNYLRATLLSTLLFLLVVPALAQERYVLDNGKFSFDIPSGWKIRTRSPKMLRLIQEDCSFFVFYRPTAAGFEKEKIRLTKMLGSKGKKLSDHVFTDVPRFQEKTEKIWLTEKGKTVVTMVTYRTKSGGGLLFPYVFYKRSAESINTEMKRMSQTFDLKLPPDPKPVAKPIDEPDPVTAPKPSPTPTVKPPSKEPDEGLDF